MQSKMAELNNNQEQRFREVLDSLKLMAQAQENVISEKVVREEFAREDIKLSREQFELVLNFLRQQEVKVSSGKQKESPDLEDVTPEERDEQFFLMYKRDLRNTKKCSKDELEALLADPAGNREAIMTACLRDVINWVEPYRESGLLVCDLVQEGNLALVEAFPQFTGTSATELKKYLRTAVQEAVMSAIARQEGQDNVSLKILGRVNAVNDCARAMAEELGRKVTFGEIAGRLNMTEEELLEIDELSGYQLENIEKEKRG